MNQTPIKRTWVEGPAKPSDIVAIMLSRSWDPPVKSKAALARMLGVSATTVQNWATDRQAMSPPIRKLIALILEQHGALA